MISANVTWRCFNARLSSFSTHCTLSISRPLLCLIAFSRSSANCCFLRHSSMICLKKQALFLSVNVFSTKVLIGGTFWTSPTGDGTAILRGHTSHAKVPPPAVQREYHHFSVILRLWLLFRPRESNLRPPALQSSALPTELNLPRLKIEKKAFLFLFFSPRIVFGGHTNYYILTPQAPKSV